MDFGEAWVIVSGVKSKAHYFVMDLPQSEDCFVAAFPAETCGGSPPAGGSCAGGSFALFTLGKEPK